MAIVRMATVDGVPGSQELHEVTGLTNDKGAITVRMEVAQDDPSPGPYHLHVHASGIKGR